MTAVVRFLAGFCREHPLDEKIFVCPSFVAGRQIGEALSREAGSWINLRFVTLPSLAQETAALELSKLERRVVAGSELLVFMDTLFRELKAADRLEYFARLKPSPGVARTLLSAIDSLRKEGLTSERIDPGLFATPEKGRDIRVLLDHYERSLAAAGGIDLPGLYRLAAQAARQTGNPAGARFLCPADTELARVEKDFLEAVSGGNCVFLDRDPVFGLERPRLFPSVTQGERSGPPDPSSDAERLPWLFNPGEGPKPFGDGSLDIFRAVSPMNECREIVRRVVGGGTALDQVELICPPGPAYVTVLHDLSRRSGIPMTFADGLPLALTSPGRVFAGLVDWIENGYLASVLCRLVESHDFRFPFRGTGEDIPPENVSRHLREAMIGWGRERFIRFLEVRRKKLEARLRDPRADEESGLPEDKRKDMGRDASEIDRLIDAVRAFLGLIPEISSSGPVLFGELSLGLAKVLEACSVLRPDVDDRDGQALGLITSELRAIAGKPGRTPASGEALPPALDLEAALDRLRTAVSSLSVGASATRPGHLHVSSFSSGGISGRPVTFVLGLDDAHFPGHGLQDPILLDSERGKLSEGLPTTADSLREGLYSMAALLSSLHGRVTFSFPAYDILEEREAFPSSLVLQVHRLQSGDLECKYEGLKEALTAAAKSAGRPDPAGFLPATIEEAIDGTDWWLGRLSRRGRPAAGLAAVRKNFPDLGAGIRAAEARAGDKLTEYEGVVRIDGLRFDPRLNRDLEVSASRLESLVKCPFGYFLKYVLGIEPPEELELDRSRWLDPMERGSLLHEILYEFMKAITERGERPDRERHGPLLVDVAEKIISSWKRQVPPPSEGIFDREKQDIRGALDVFLKVESARPKNVRPFAFEKGFSGVPIEVEGGGSFSLKGRIDRIDRTGPDTFRVIDYKTGSPKPYEELVAFGRGRVIQHALYALAVEKFLVKEGPAEKVRVTESGYSFPTRRGEGREVLVPAFDRKTFRALLRDILDLISKGYFISALKDECGFCDFSSVCGGRPKETKKKVEANEKINQAFERLKDYD